MSDHDHSHEPFPPFDSDDPLSMMGAAMVGMSLQEMAEEEERERRAGLTAWQRTAEDRRARELAPWIFAAVVAGGLFLLCLFLSVASAGY